MLILLEGDLIKYTNPEFIDQLQFYINQAMLYEGECRIIKYTMYNGVELIIGLSAKGGNKIIKAELLN